MEILSQVVSGPILYAVSAVIAVVIGAVSVFVFGFKKAEQPAFDKLSSSSADDRKQAGKKRKIKEKKSTANGHATGVTDNASKQKSAEVKTSPVKKAPLKEKAAPVVKEAPQAPAKQLKEKKQDTESPAKENLKKVDKKLKSKGKENKEVVVIKNKKNLKQKQPEEKPLDFDDGNWEIVPAKGDKKNRKTQDEIVKDLKKESPKKSKKPKKVDSDIVEVIPQPVIDNKSVDEVTKEIKDMVNEQQKAAAEVEKKAEIVLTPTIEVEVATKAEPVQNSESKKKKNKKVASKNEELEKVVEPVPASAPAPKKEKKKAENIVESPKSTEVVAESAVAFDELGDVWTEAKAPKKSKKKARKE